MDNLFQDLRCACRMLIKHAAFTFVVVLSIGLGIGANTTVFTWMESMILNPYPMVKDYSRLVAINTASQDGTGAGAPLISYQTYLDWREAAQSFDEMAVHISTRLNLRAEGEQQGAPVWGEMVSGNYFEMLGVGAAQGRAFSLDEEINATPVAVLSHSLWQRRFNSDPSIIGSRLLLNGAEVTVMGVAPEGFRGALVGYGWDLWLPVTLQPLVTQGPNRINDRAARWLQGTARLKEGVTLEQARAEMKILARQISEARGEFPVSGAMVRLMRERFGGAVFYPLFTVLLIVTGLVLLITCSNIAGLLVARASSRQREIAIRLALGSSRARIIRQLLLESIMLSIAGGIAGLLIALWAKDVFSLFIPPTPQPVAYTITINPRVIGFAFAVALLTALIFGLGPALRASKPDLIPVLKDEERGSSASRSRLRNVLVAAQVALSMVALVCAGLFLRSLSEGQRMNLGFSDPAHVLLVGVDFNVAGLKEREAQVAASRLLELTRSLPGVTGATYSTMVPLGFGGHASALTKVDGYAPAPDEQMTIERVIVGDDYFETMGIPIVGGRPITEQDSGNSLRIAVVNEAFARHYWPGQDPLGKRIDQGQGWATVVGVARDAMYDDIGEEPYPVVYSALRQWYAPAITLHVRTVGDPKLMTATLRNEFTALNADLPFFDPRTLAEHISAATIGQFVGASMLSAFGALALLIATVGIYGIIAFVVTQRRRELAIRMALGASPSDVMRLVLGRGLIATASGLGAGALIALTATRLLRSQLLGVSPADPLTFVAVALLLAAVATIACYIPARRATRLDPVSALRCE